MQQHRSILYSSIKADDQPHCIKSQLKLVSKDESDENENNDDKHQWKPSDKGW